MHIPFQMEYRFGEIEIDCIIYCIKERLEEQLRYDVNGDG